MSEQQIKVPKTPVEQFINKGGKFMHLRWYYDEDETELIQNAGVTVAYRYDPTANELRVAFSRCHPNDNFNKKIGRAITVGRMIHGDYYFVPIPNEKTHFDTVYEFVTNKLAQHDDAQDQTNSHNPTG